MASSSNHLKVVIVGECGVGKTSLLLRFTDNEFNEAHAMSLGVDSKSKTISVGGQSMTMQLWDTAGSERFRNVTTSYWHGAHIALLCYDISDKASFEKMNDWKGELSRYGPTTAVVVVCGLKSDLTDPKREVSADEGSDFAKSIEARHFFETSSKTGAGVDKLFEQAAQTYIRLSSGDDKPAEPTFAEVKHISTSAKKSGGGGKKSCAV